MLKSLYVILIIFKFYILFKLDGTEKDVVAIADVIDR